MDYHLQHFRNYWSHGDGVARQLRPTLKRIDLYVIRWARRKYKRLRLCHGA